MNKNSTRRQIQKVPIMHTLLHLHYRREEMGPLEIGRVQPKLNREIQNEKTPNKIIKQSLFFAVLKSAVHFRFFCTPNLLRFWMSGDPNPNRFNGSIANYKRHQHQKRHEEQRASPRMCHGEGERHKKNNHTQTSTKSEDQTNLSSSTSRPRCAPPW